MTDIRRWLDSLGFSQYAAVFEENAIEWEHLPDLGHEVLQALGVTAAVDQLKRGLRFDKDDNTQQRLEKVDESLRRLGLNVWEYAPDCP